MAKLDAYLEAERRGILPREKAVVLDEARRRGLVPMPSAPDPTKPTVIGGMVVPPPPPPSKTSGVAAALLGAGQGASFGFGDEALSALAAGGAKLMDYAQVDRLLGKELDKSYSDIYKAELAKNKEYIDDAAQNHTGAYIAGNIAGAVGTGIAGGATKAGAAINNSLRSGGLLARAAKGAAAGSASGGLYGAGSADSDKRLEGFQEGAAAGAVVGGVVPVAGALSRAVGRGAKRTVIPRISDSLKPLVQRAQDFGIPLRADQVAPSRVRNTVQKISQEIPFSGVDNFEETQRTAFTKAVARTIGQDSDNVGPDTIQKFLSDSSQKFNNALSGRDFGFNKLDMKQLDGIGIQADDHLTEDVAKIVRTQIGKVISDIPPGGAIDGQKLASLRSRLVSSSASADSRARPYIGKIVDWIDDVVGSQVQGKEEQSLKEARRHWRNFRTIEPLLEKSTDGSINPTDLMSRVASSKFIKASRTETGKDDLVDLARIGKTFLSKKGGSDTAQKAALGTGGVGLLGLAATNPLLAATLAAKAGGVAALNRYGIQGLNQSQKAIQAALKQTGSTTARIPSNPLLAITAAQALTRH